MHWLLRSFPSVPQLTAILLVTIVLGTVSDLSLLHQTLHLACCTVELASHRIFRHDPFPADSLVCSASKNRDPHFELLRLQVERDPRWSCSADLQHGEFTLGQ